MSSATKSTEIPEASCSNDFTAKLEMKNFDRNYEKALQKSSESSQKNTIRYDA